MILQELNILDILEKLWNFTETLEFYRDFEYFRETGYLKKTLGILERLDAVEKLNFERDFGYFKEANVLRCLNFESMWDFQSLEYILY